MIPKCPPEGGRYINLAKRDAHAHSTGGGADALFFAEIDPAFSYRMFLFELFRIPACVVSQNVFEGDKDDEHLTLHTLRIDGGRAKRPDWHRRRSNYRSCADPFFGLSQHQAQGTTLAMLIPPVGILAAWAYYKQGYVLMDIAGYMCVGFLVGGFFGARIATHLSNLILERIFGLALLLIAMKMLFAK